MSTRQRRMIEMAQLQQFKKVPNNARRDTLRKVDDGFLCDLFEEDISGCKEAPTKKVVYDRGTYSVVVYLCAHCVTTYDVGDGEVVNYSLNDLLPKRKKVKLSVVKKKAA